jgi:hypothetical protein
MPALSRPHISFAPTAPHGGARVACVSRRLRRWRFPRGYSPQTENNNIQFYY